MSASSRPTRTGLRQETHRNLALDMLARQSRTVHQHRRFLALNLRRKPAQRTGDRQEVGFEGKAYPEFQAQKNQH